MVLSASYIWRSVVLGGLPGGRTSSTLIGPCGAGALLDPLPPLGPVVLPEHAVTPSAAAADRTITTLRVRPSPIARLRFLRRCYPRVAAGEGYLVRACIARMRPAALAGALIRQEFVSSLQHYGIRDTTGGSSRGGRKPP